ncbi:hypothetical protein JYU34_022223, partial [Plutella xylostella]
MCDLDPGATSGTMILTIPTTSITGQDLGSMEEKLRELRGLPSVVIENDSQLGIQGLHQVNHRFQESDNSISLN